MTQSQNQSISCPVCSTKITFDAYQLLMGKEFTCPNCHQSIGLTKESKPLIQETMEKLEKMKDKGAK